MADDSLSASQLRNQYHQGGSKADSELSASQLRARHGVASNESNFSTKHNQQGSSAIIIGLVLLGVLVVGIILFFTLGAGNSADPSIKGEL